MEITKQQLVDMLDPLTPSDMQVVESETDYSSSLYLMSRSTVFKKDGRYYRVHYFDSIDHKIINSFGHERACEEVIPVEVKTIVYMTPAEAFERDVIFDYDQYQG